MTSPDPMVRRSQRVIRMVSELHRLGYQRLRIMPYVYPLAYRVAIAPRAAFSARNGAWLAHGYDDYSGSYTAAAAADYFGWTDARTDDARALAEKYIARFPRLVEQGRGRDWEYAGWLAELVGYLERGSLLPFVQEEDFPVPPQDLTYLPIWDLASESGEPRTDFPLPPPVPGRDD